MKEGYLLKTDFTSSSENVQGEFFLEKEIEQRLIEGRRIHLENPSIPATELSNVTGLGFDDILTLYKNLQSDRRIHALVDSPFYPHKLMYRFACSVVNDWVSDPIYTEELVKGEAAARTVEIHATKGTCDYECAMCLWSDKQEFVYSGKDRLLSKDDWINFISTIQYYGTKTIVFSGGGEPILNRDFIPLIDHTHKLGLNTHLYTNGFSLNALLEQDQESLTQMERIRFSIHSPNPETYNKIVHLPHKVGALKRVSENIAQLIELKNKAHSSTRVGIGFVIQQLNYNQIVDMTDYAAELGVDYFNIRRDEVNITDALTSRQIQEVVSQLNTIRDHIVRGGYSRMYIDISDSLTALANGDSQSMKSTNLCMSPYFRPAVSPYGVWAACDLKAEPRFEDSNYILGDIRRNSVGEILNSIQEINVPANCDVCMPSGRTGNAIYAKLLADYKMGINFNQQPFYFQQGQF